MICYAIITFGRCCNSDLRALRKVYHTQEAAVRAASGISHVPSVVRVVSCESEAQARKADISDPRTYIETVKVLR